ncbi:MAG: efflux RND transporter periplasmic adaptor subunit [Pseudohongiellaceae bacterium]
MKKLAITAIVLAGGALAAWFISVQPTPEAAPGANQSGMAAPPEVAVMTVREQTVELAEELPGRVYPYRIAQIRPQVGGIVTVRHFDEGASVEAGEVLYQIDPSRYTAAVDSAQARVLSARADLKAAELRAERFEELRSTEAISQQQYDDAEVALDKARAGLALTQAELSRAELDLEYTRVYAPISGRIGRSYVSEGALVTTGQADPMAIVTQLDPVFVDISQSSSEHMQWRSNMSPDQKIRVTLRLGEGSTAHAHEGQLQFSDVLVDQSTGSVQLRALFPNPEATLLPGLFVTARLHLGSDQAVLIPQQALTRDESGAASVWVLQEGSVVTPRPVQVGRVVDDQWVIEEGLNPGDTLVVEGFQRITPGAAVTPVLAEAP